MSKHHKCGREIPGGETGGHCGNCCRSFRGLGAFDMHLARRDDGSGRSDCIEPSEAVDGKGNPRPFWIDRLGIWHHGDRRPADSYGTDVEEEG